MSKDVNFWRQISTGIEDGKRSYCGPHTVQIDLTDKCNSTCIGCWVHSPLVKKEEIFPEGHKELDFNLVKKLIKQLYKVGTREIILSGSGEPFLYSKIKEVVKIVKSKGIYLNIITNVTLINEEMAMLLVKCKVDLITASIWAGNSAVYASTHPGKTAADFEKITNGLTKLAFYKKKWNSLSPHLKLYNVICGKNCHDIENMVEFAKEVDGDSVEFQVVDIIPDKTESLSLASEDRERIVRQLEKIRERDDLIPFNTPREVALSKYANEEFLDFGKIWKNSKEKFYLSRYSNSLMCKKGYNISSKRVVVSESTSTEDAHPVTFRYGFKNKLCRNCTERDSCLDKKSVIDIKLLNMLGIGSFLRRLFYSDLGDGIYEKQINDIPCYIGWYYARILTDGSVVPCCKGAKFPLGSIYDASFSKIWHSSLYKEFRSKAKNSPKSDKYFSKLNCIKSCDNWGMNLEIHKKFKHRKTQNHMITKEKNLVSITAEKGSNSYFSFIKKIILKKGFMTALGKVCNNFKVSYLKDRHLEMLGIYDRKHGYKGPFHVQIDLTNNCNNSCIACWCNSPLFKAPRLSRKEKEQYLPIEIVKELLDETSHMGATEVYFSGSGEPFMHPQIMKVLEHAKKKNLICHVNTNFTLLDKEKIDRLIDIGVDFLTVSTWAATAETYVKTHINRTEDDFSRIKENLIYLNAHKKDKPRIKLYNVIFNMNYLEVEKMVDFTKITNSESLEFTLVDTIPNITDILSLSEEQVIKLAQLCLKIKSGLDNQSRIRDGNVLVFQFEQFFRRISIVKDAKEAKYDRNIINNMPCYIGWLFVRIIPNGEVHSCLKAHRIPTGSLYANRFFEIWNSKKQEYFRKKTLGCKKSDPFFKLIGNDPGTEEAGCYKSCDDIGRNTWMHNRLSMLSFPERILLKGIACMLKMARRIRFQKKKKHLEYHRNPIIAGIVHGRKAFTGPEQVVIDITNKCNLKCISCWLYSPLLNKDQPSQDWLEKELPKETLFKLIEDLAFLGTKKIRFTGGGEPFMHKDAMEIIEFTRKKQLEAAVTTNFGLVSKEQIRRLIDLNIEELCISIWASNPKVYARVHPGVSAIYFEKLKEKLFYLKEIRGHKPRLTFANVIMNNNFLDFEEMYKMGCQYNVDAIYFTLVDTLLGQTDTLLLNTNERERLFKKAQEIKEISKKDGICLEFFEGFLRRLSMPADNLEKGEYDKLSIDKIPCYVGWIFTRVLADGSVAPCCRGVKKIMGNSNKKSFKDIWFSDIYNEFRAKAKYLPKTDIYFNDIGCIKECDNLMHNEQIYKKICPVSP